MDPRLLDLYNQELKFIREMGAEFAQEYPKVAARLGLEGFDCADPYVERLLEGFAFLTARVQLQLNNQFPKFTENLINHLFPTFLMPTPSMTVCKFEPDLDEGSLLAGIEVKKGTSIRSQLSKGEQTSCEYKTVKDFTLLPLTICQAEYLNAQAISAISANHTKKNKSHSAIQLTLSCDANYTMAEICASKLNLYLRGSEALPMNLFELLYKGFQQLWFRDDDKSNWKQCHQGVKLNCTEFEHDGALMPYNPRYFDGFRLIKEYFLFPKRFLFLALEGIQAVLEQSKTNEVQLLLLLSEEDTRLENHITADNFSLSCVPAINLFSRKTDRIKISETQHQYHVVVDKLRPTDYEICAIETVTGFSAGVQVRANFSPFFKNSRSTSGDGNYYAIERKPRKLTAKQKRLNSRSSYIGTETFISLVEQQQTASSEMLSQLSVSALCSNRDLAILMSVGKGKTDFSLDISLPCQSIRCVEGPTRPEPPMAKGELNWALISHLTFNYLGFEDCPDQSPTQHIKQLLSLFVAKNDVASLKQIDGIVALNFTRTTRRIELPGPICFARGTSVELILDEECYEGTGVFLLGMILDQFFARLVSVNSFTQFTLSTTNNGEIFTWPVRIGMKVSL